MPLIPEFEEDAQNYLKHFEQIYLGGADAKRNGCFQPGSRNYFKLNKCGIGLAMKNVK